MNCSSFKKPIIIPPFIRSFTLYYIILVHAHLVSDVICGTRMCYAPHGVRSNGFNVKYRFIISFFLSRIRDTYNTRKKTCAIQTYSIMYNIHSIYFMKRRRLHHGGCSIRGDLPCNYQIIYIYKFFFGESFFFFLRSYK